MIKYNFKDDYSEGVHPDILQAISKTNLEQQDGYGNDEYCQQAATTLKNKLNNQQVDVHFVSGGTQANLIVISSILKPYESVIAASTGHINVHEAGAIESTGHKINTIVTKNGKLTPELIKPILEEHSDEHMVKPRLVYISNTTEVGTVYDKKELQVLFDFCRQNNLFLYLDGARIGAAICSKNAELELSDLPKLTDIFYIGATKNGALLGDAIVIVNGELKKDFRFSLKQKGALLAKGRILGVQFLELFKNDLYFELASHANAMAEKLHLAISQLGYSFLSQPESNQIFPILPNEIVDELSKAYGFYAWSKTDENNQAIRLVTSWATREEMVDSFIEDLRMFKGQMVK